MTKIWLYRTEIGDRTYLWKISDGTSLSIHGENLPSLDGNEIEVRYARYYGSRVIDNYIKNLEASVFVQLVVIQ